MYGIGNVGVVGDHTTFAAVTEYDEAGCAVVKSNGKVATDTLGSAIVNTNLPMNWVVSS